MVTYNDSNRKEKQVLKNIFAFSLRVLYFLAMANWPIGIELMSQNYSRAMALLSVDMICRLVEKK